MKEDRLPKKRRYFKKLIEEHTDVRTENSSSPHEFSNYGFNALGEDALELYTPIEDALGLYTPIEDALGLYTPMEDALEFTPIEDALGLYTPIEDALEFTPIEDALGLYTPVVENSSIIGNNQLFLTET